MRTYPFRTPYLLTQAFSGLTWRVDAKNEKNIYLTFDDGPHPEVTPYVLDLLDQHKAKATFFVVGANVEKYPELLQLVQSKGHATGNHTQHHLSGWRTATATYRNDVATCETAMTQAIGSSDLKLFRPPYGRITPSQIRSLKSTHEIVMWSMLSGDFDQDLNITAAKKALDQSKPGEVIVFHDSHKSQGNLKQLLPWFLERFHRKGYKFATLSPLK
ncbi:MAG: polysaccharide deacetylase family protein [Cytophagales bacterium]|nr:polysaccharide deacetylase family protein [Cytophagales bacterium]